MLTCLVLSDKGCLSVSVWSLMLFGSSESFSIRDYFLAKPSLALRLVSLLRPLQKICEPRHDKNQHFAYAKTKTQISFAVTAKLISAFVFAT